MFVLSQLPWYYIIDNLTLQHHTYHHKVPKTQGIRSKGPLKMFEKSGNSKTRSSKNPCNLKGFLKVDSGDQENNSKNRESV